MSDDRLTQQLRFLLELDRLKSVFRQSRLIHTDRMENSAEHSWHLGMLAVVLAEYAAEGHRPGASREDGADPRYCRD